MTINDPYYNPAWSCPHGSLIMVRLNGKTAPPVPVLYDRPANTVGLHFGWTSFDGHFSLRLFPETCVVRHLEAA